jgi:two-component system nitrogen regulation sensor histidine kinase NtrY
MMSKLNIRHTLLLFLVSVVLAISSGSILKKLVFTSNDQKKFQQELNRKFDLLEQVVTDYNTDGHSIDLKKADKRGITLLVYREDSLIYWSNNRISVLSIENLQHDTSRFSFISNSWYIIRKYMKADSLFVSLLKIKDEYPYQNEFLQNTFQRNLKIPYTTQITFSPENSDISLYDWDNRYLFSLTFDGALKYLRLTRYLPPVLYLFVLMFFLLLVDSVFKQVSGGSLKNLLFFVLAFILIACRILQVKYHFPGAVYNLELFGPFLFARSLFMPSLGDVLLNSILIIFFVIRFRDDFYYGSFLSQEKSRKSWIVIILLTILLTAYFVFAHYVFSSLILNSSINFETFKVTGLTVYTFIGLLVMAIHMAGLLLFSDHILNLARGKMPFGWLNLIFTLSFGAGMLVLRWESYPIDFISFAGFFLFFVILSLIHYHKPITYSYSTLLIFVFLFAVFSVHFISRYTELKEKNDMKVLVDERLTSEHDIVAEYLLEGLDKKIVNDTTLAGYLFDLDYSIEDIFNHLRDNYFKGFWGKYSLRFTDCMPSYDLLTNTRQNCYAFFDALIQEKGIQLDNTNFYFIDTLNGRINYLGRIKYVSPDKEEVTLFIELESRLIAEELGYPKLLIEKYSKGSILHDYSYAKYYKGRLITQEGGYLYSLTLDDKEKTFFTAQGYDHRVFVIDEDNTIVVSKPSTTFFTRLVSFSYIFVFYYLLVLIFISIRYLATPEKSIIFNFKNKIQFSILSVLLLSLVLIGGGTIYFSIEQYKKKQYDILSEYTSKSTTSWPMFLPSPPAGQARITKAWDSSCRNFLMSFIPILTCMTQPETCSLLPGPRFLKNSCREKR